MNSLTEHLVEPGDHGSLRFHPSCPVCRRERLYGTLSSEPVVPRRAQALLAGGVLAVSTAGPAVSVAQEPDRQFEGVAAPDQMSAPDLDDPAFDPGGETDLSFDTAPAPAAPEDGDDSGEGAPLDVEPTVDVDAQIAPFAETDAGVGDEQSAVPPAETVQPDVAAPPSDVPGGVIPPGTSAQPLSPGTPGGPPAPPEGHGSPRKPPAQAGLLAADRPRTHVPSQARSTYQNVQSDAGAPASSQRVSDGAGASPEPFVATSQESAATRVTSNSPPAREAAGGTIGVSDQPTTNQPPLNGDSRIYVVQSGDSLWSIAKRLLGRDASAGLIAREVNRLWSLNSSRIATGDPDLLMVGTRLEVR
jgi:LysM repeat protein